MSQREHLIIKKPKICGDILFYFCYLNTNQLFKKGKIQKKKKGKGKKKGTVILHLMIFRKACDIYDWKEFKIWLE